MNPKATITRKLLEALPAVQQYATEQRQCIEYYEYERTGVKGIAYDPNKVPTASPGGHNRATDWEAQISNCRCELEFCYSIMRWLERYADTLTDEERELIHRRYIGGETVEQIAATENITPDAVKYRISQILAKK